jgi:hypothetical protein
MALMPTGFVHQQEIKFAIERVQSRFAQQVDHINYSFGENWSGEPSIFFRVVVRDEASPIDRLLELADQVSISLMNEAKTDENGLYAYFDFRSMAEQARLQEPAWA